MPKPWIGCSGFTYHHWKGVFYPQDLPERKWFEYYSTVFSSVELNVTFYRLPRESAFDGWYKKSPHDFGFALKGSRFITHVKRLLDPVEPVKLFFGRASRLKEKLHAVLWQFSPAFKVNAGRLAGFLKALRKYPVRNALEFRHESWITDDVIGICKEHNVCLCMADWPEFIDDLPATADFVYLRRHGEGGGYATCYSKSQLRKDAVRIRKHLSGGRDVFIYFNNDAFGYAPENARELTSMLKGRAGGIENRKAKLYHVPRH